MASLHALAEEESAWEPVSPIATVTFSPLTEPPPLAAEIEGSELQALPEHRPVDEATWEAMKEAAKSDPLAPAPDDVLTLEEPKSPPPRFPGIGWDFLFPADVSIAKSPNRLIEVVNSNIRLFDSAGGVIAGKILANFFFTSATPIPPFDPRVIFDRAGANPRFYVVATQYRPAGIGTPFARIFLAVSRSPNPPNLELANWCIYSASALDDYDSVPGHTFADQPNLGVGADILMLTDNRFTIQEPKTFTYAVIHAFDKAQLSNNGAGCQTGVATVFRPATSLGDLNTFALQPVNHTTYPSSFTGTTNPAYAASARFGSETRYSVYRVRNITQGASSRQLQRTSFDGVTLYGNPPDAPERDQPGVLVDTGDTRVLQSVGVGNSLWFAHTSLCQNGGGPNESCFRTVKVDVGQSSAGAPTATLREHKLVGGGANVFYMFPGIAVNGAGRIAVPFMRSSATTYPSSLWAGKNSTQASFGAPQPLTLGTCPREGQTFPPGQPGVARAGDYLGAQVDPVDFTSFWIAGERSAFFPPGLNRCTWDTEIIHVN